MQSILSSKADIIFLSDIRANTNRHNQIIDFLKCTPFGNYEIVFNSDSSIKRGVAILYNTALGLRIDDTYRSNDFNVLLINVSLKGQELTLGSIYGPKAEDDRLFFNTLRQTLTNFGKPNFLIGGDHNAICCAIEPSIDYLNVHSKRQKYNNTNIELLNQSVIPNKAHTEQIVQAIDEGFWYEPFRFKYPEKKEYSYIPSQRGATGRSRLDFFLCNANLLDVIDRIYYENTITDFDHKRVTLTFDCNRAPKAPKVDSNLLFTPGILEIGIAETLALLSIHTDGIVPGTVQAYSQVTDQICNLGIFACEKGRTDLLLDSFIESKRILAEHIQANMPISMGDLLNGEMDINPALFLETLQNNIKIRLVLHQKRYLRAEKREITLLEKRLALLKSNCNALCEDIFDLDTKISNLLNEQNLRKCKSALIWRNLNLEKPTRSFCNVAKSLNSGESLGVIKNPITREDFNTKEDRSHYISDFYRTIYKKGNARDFNIDNFLSPDISNSDYVRLKKLSEDTKASFENDISLFEMDKAIAKAKKGTSPGRDGWSFSALNRLWAIFRIPTKRAFDFMVSQGSLEYSLKQVSVRLIPKKGDLTVLNNWRPISLLSVFYKIPASAYAARLSNVIDQICDVRQKAYSHSKVISECLIAIIDNIEKCKHYDSQAAILLVDFSKAFDKLNHGFVLSALEFFNFGPKMLQIAKTLLTSRIGSIITEEGLTPSFDFDAGTGQGAPESCYLFLIALEILLIKLKLCPSLERIIVPSTIYENGTETLEGCGFADDVSLFLKATHQNLINAKLILNNFLELSDLAVNWSKTAVVPIQSGDNQDFIDAINNEGLTVTRSFKLLGFDLTNDNSNLHKNVDNLIEKINKIVSFWTKFNLSTAGRINIFKTYILSNISYFCTILNIDPSYYNILDRISYRFVTGKLNVAFEAAFKDPALGGLGLVKSRLFVQALRVGMFKKALNSTDSWALVIKSFKRANSPLNIRPTGINATLNPCAARIAAAFATFAPAFYRVNSNILHAPIFENRSLLRFANGTGLYFENVFGGRVTENVLDLRLVDILDVPTLSIKPFRQIFALIPGLTWEEYGILVY